MWWPFPVLSWGSLLALLFLPVLVAVWVWGALSWLADVIVRLPDLMRRAPVATPVNAAHRRGALKGWVR